MGAVTFPSIDALLDAVGADLGVSRWVEIDQRRIDLFADATEDRQWIHVDPERAANGPFGSTIAHGYLTLALVSSFVEDLLRVDGVGLAVNYGLNRVRFPAPVPVGSKVRAHGEIASVSRAGAGVQVELRVTIERDGHDRPVCVAEVLFHMYP